jgi:hypothetical protein
MSLIHHLQQVADDRTKKEEKKYLQMTAQESYQSQEQLMQRLIELLHYQQNRLAYRKRTEIALLQMHPRFLNKKSIN